MPAYNLNAKAAFTLPVSEYLARCADSATFRKELKLRGFPRAATLVNLREHMDDLSLTEESVLTIPERTRTKRTKAEVARLAAQKANSTGFVNAKCRLHKAGYGKDEIADAIAQAKAQNITLAEYADTLLGEMAEAHDEIADAMAASMYDGPLAPAGAEFRRTN